MKKMLVSAYGCEYGKGSEPGVGWNWILLLAQRYELWVVTRNNNRDSIEEYLPDDVKGNIHFLYYDLPDWIRKVKKREKGLYWYYYLWQCGSLRVIKKEMKNVQWDYAMHLTFGSMWMPTFLYKLNIPFIWGPLGGGEAVPKQYMGEFGLKERIVQSSRWVMMGLKWLNLPLVIRCHKAELIIARTPDTIRALPVVNQSKVVVILETGVEEETLRLVRRDSEPMQEEEIHLIYTGRLVAFKGMRLLIEAIAKCRNREKITLSVVGEGPRKDDLMKLTRKKGLEHQVIFLGQRDRQGALSLLKQADMYVFPSLREGGTWSLMEAMAAGLPCVCINTSGMKTITDETSAVRIEPQNPDDTINEISKAIDTLIDDRDYAVTLGKNARERIETAFTWDAKRDTLFNELDKLEKRGK